MVVKCDIYSMVRWMLEDVSVPGSGLAGDAEDELVKSCDEGERKRGREELWLYVPR